MYHWAVRDLILQIKASREGDIGSVCPKNLASDERAAVWKFGAGFWVCDIESGGTCGQGTAAGRARCFGESRVAVIRENWADLQILLPTDGGAVLFDEDRFYRVYGKLHLAMDSYICAKLEPGSAHRPRFGRFRCHCGDYATYEVCVLTEALGRYEGGIELQSWDAGAKIRKGKDEHPTRIHRMRRDIRNLKETPQSAYFDAMDPEIELACGGDLADESRFPAPISSIS